MAVGRRHGLALGRARTAHTKDILRGDDLVIAVCDNAHEHLTTPPGQRLHWSVPDPAPADTDAAFEAAYTDLAAGVSFKMTPALTLSLQGTNLTNKFSITEGNPRGNNVVAGNNASGFARANLPRVHRSIIGGATQ